MAKASVQPDVLVLGCHPSAFFATALLKQVAGLRVMHAGLQNDRYADRLILINPLFFELHPLLSELKSELELTETRGLNFLADEPGTANSYSSKRVTAYIAGFKQIQSGLQKLAGVSSGDSAAPLTVHGIDETGVDLTIGKTRHRPKLILLAGPLPAEQRQALGLAGEWDSEVLHRYSFLRVKPAKVFPAEHPQQQLVPMSLDLNGSLAWAWLLATDSCVQFSIEQPAKKAETIAPATLMQHWCNVLAAHGAVKSMKVTPSQVTSIDLPFAGALSQDLVANRTLLFGPAGGFYSACAEDLYPCCWSALFAVAAAKTALKERFLQDALQAYRQKWGATLGDYLRGPQQNLKFLLPLVYRNGTMAARLAEAILAGESVVR